MQINDLKESIDNGDKNLNIILKNEEDNKNEIELSLSDIAKSFRKFALVWIALSVLAVLIVSAGTAAFSHQLSTSPVSLIGFDYPGVEKGLTPNGEKLDVNSIKNPKVIEAALTKLDYPLSNVDSIRNAISIEGIIPHDAADEISVYKQAMENGNGNLSAAQNMLNVDYFPVQYKVTFDFSKTTFGDDEAAQVINTILQCYRDYFFMKYGNNTEIGNASLAVNYSDYDYLVAVDTYSDTLDTLQDKIENLKNKNFRSTNTGFSFMDLSNSISSVKAYDADALTAYILSNSVISDKNSMISFYEYRIDELGRRKKAAEDNLKTIENSIKNYEKDSVIIYSSASQDPSSEYTTYSKKYDDLFQQKQDAQKDVSYYTTKISECQERLDSVKKLKNGKASDTHVNYVEKRIAALDETVKQLVDDVNDTIYEYNESVTFANAYSVLVPANVLSKSYLSMLAANIMKPLILVEGGLLVLYILVSVIYGIKTTNSVKKDQEPETETV